MPDDAPSFDLDFEEDILSRCLVDTDYLRTAAPILGSHHLGTKQYSWVWDVIRDTWINFAERPTAKVLLHRARADFPDDDDRTSYLEIVRKLRRREPEAPKAALEELRRFTRFVGYQGGIQKAVDALGDADLDACREALSGALRDDIVAGSYEVCRWADEFEERQARRKHRAEHPDEILHIPTGISGLDRIIRGVQPEELAIVMATTNRGKSIWLINIAYWAMVRGFKVAMVTTEMGLEQTATRMDSRSTSMLYDRFKEWSFSPEELRKLSKRASSLREKLSQRLRLIRVPVGSSILLCRQAFEEMRSEMGGLDMVILDSADHLKPSTDHRDFRLNQSQTYWDFMAMLQEEKWAGWSSTQAGREWATRTAKAEAASESYDKSRICDLMVTLNEPSKRDRTTVIDDDDDTDPDAAPDPTPMLEGFLAKARDSEARLKFPIETDLARMLMKGGSELDD